MDAKSSVCFSDEGARKVMKLNIRGVLRQFKNAKFLDPLFEAIANALDAGAKNIEIELFEDKDGLDVNPKPLVGYSVKDDGEGFTKKNRAAFSELYTDNRKDIGGKGSGRFKALVVFDHVEIDSCTGNEHVSLHFTREFDGEDDFMVHDETCEKRTTLTFLGRSELYTKKEFPSYSAKDVLGKVFDHFLPRLVMLKTSTPDGVMTFISPSREKAQIRYCDLPDVQEETFRVQNVSVDFTMRSCVLPRSAEKSCAWFCANDREVKEIKELAEIKNLQGDHAIVILVSSAYLDENINEDRTAFTIDNEGFISLEEIGRVSSERAMPVIKDVYPNINVMNEAVIQAAIDEAPALAHYIRLVRPSVVLSKEDVLRNARKKFLTERDKVRDDFCRLLNKSNTPDEVFCEKVGKVSEMAHIELAEYILYRQAIIDAFARLPEESDAKEKRLHDLLMPMRTEAYGKQLEKHTLTNLWLLDDAFMNYLYAASDKTMVAIRKALGRDESPTRANARPDLFVFFSSPRHEDGGDALIIELKGPHASKEEKKKAITELPDNMADIREILGDTAKIWGYVITAFDDDIRRTLNVQSYIPMVNTDGKPNAYYKFMSSPLVNAIVTAIDISWIAGQANARNKTFMDILKG